MSKIIETYVDHSNQTVDITIGKTPRKGGAYHFNSYNNISPSSQQRVLEIIKDYSTKYTKGHLVTYFEYPNL